MLIGPSLYSTVGLVCAVLGASRRVYALYTAGDDVLLLTAKTFPTEVLATEHAVLVEFFAPWCGHCKALAPHYKKSATNLKGIVKVAAVDCDVAANAPLCQKYEIQGFPTIKLFPGASSTPDESGKFTNYKVPQDYGGARTAKAIVDYAIKKVPSYVVLVSSKPSNKKTTGIDEFLARQLPKALLFSNKNVTTPLYKALSVDFHYTMLLGEVRASEEKIINRYQVKKFPSLLVFSKGEDSPTVYDGPVNYESLFKFLKTFARPASAKMAEDKESSEGKRPKQDNESTPQPEKFDPTISQIVTQEDLQSNCLDKLGICVLAFLVVEPEFEESLREHNKTLSMLLSVKESFHSPTLSSPFRFYWIDGLSETRLPDDFRITDNRPTLMALNAQRRVYRPFTGGFDEEGVKRWLKDIIAGRGRSFSYDFTPTMTAASGTEDKKTAKSEADGDRGKPDREEL